MTLSSTAALSDVVRELRKVCIHTTCNLLCLVIHIFYSLRGGRRACVRMNRLVSTPCWGLIRVRPQVHKQITVSIRIWADQPCLKWNETSSSVGGFHKKPGKATHVELWPTDGGDTPFNSITRPLESSCGRWCCGPRYFEFHDCRVSSVFYDSVQL